MSKNYLQQYLINRVTNNSSINHENKARSNWPNYYNNNNDDDDNYINKLLCQVSSMLLSKNLFSLLVIL